MLQQAKDVLTLPESAIQYEGDQTYVFVHNGTEYVRRDVVTGLSDGVNIQIKEGLQEGEIVRGPKIINGK